MKQLMKKAQRGFTLIELMIVVAIVGILAVLAIYGVRKYLANAKTAEARNSLGEIGKDAATAYEKESMSGSVVAVGQGAGVSRALCLAASVPVPALVTQVAGQKYQSDSAVGTDWNADVNTAFTPTGGASPVLGHAGFYCLKFVMDQPQYYMYSYLGAAASGLAGDKFTAVANGDLNGDGTTSTFSLFGTVNATMALNIAPNITEVNPEE